MPARLPATACGLLLGAALMAPPVGHAGEAPPADAPSSLKASVELGVGHESYSSPLFRLTPEAQLVYLEGLSRLKGAHVKTAAQLQAHHALSNGWGLSLSADASLKHAPHTRDLRLATASVQPMVNKALPGASVGIGPIWQRIDVAGQRFRTTRGTQGNVTWFDADGKGLWALIGEASRYRHPADLASLDTAARVLIVQRTWTQPGAGFDQVQASFHLRRERNLAGVPELASRGPFAHVSGQMPMGDWTTSAGVGRQAARYDAAAFADQPVRRDRAWLMDLGAERSLTERDSLRLEFNALVNRSNVRLYESRFRGAGVTWRRQL